jgi:hypothetical protein
MNEEETKSSHLNFRWYGFLLILCSLLIDTMNFMLLFIHLRFSEVEEILVFMAILKC